jgi:DNA invertase Pin-like site-specific DNA recombinase
MENEPINIVSYVRESTLDQSLHGYRPEVQREHIACYCNYHNFKIVKEFEDSGSGGSIEFRPSFKAMIDFVKSDKSIRFIVIDETSRFFRNLNETLNFETELEKKYDVYAVDTRIDYEPRKYLEGGLSAYQWDIRMQARLRAEMERKVIQLRVKEGYARKINNGQYAGDMAYGLEWKDEHKKYVGYKTNEANIVGEIFSLYKTGNYGFQSLADHLNKLGYKRETVRRRRVDSGGTQVLQRVKTEEPFTFDIMKSILKNKSYIGVQNRKPCLKLKTLSEVGTECFLHQLISENDFNYVQQLIKTNRRGQPMARIRKTSRQKSIFLVQGIAHSAVNGAKLHGQTETSKSTANVVRRYIPSTNKAGTHEHIPSIKADEVEQGIIDLIRHVKIKDIGTVENMLRELILKEAKVFSRPFDSTTEQLKRLKTAVRSLKAVQKTSFSYHTDITIKDYEKQARELLNKSNLSEEQMRYYDMMEIKAVLSDVSKEFLQLQDMSAKEELVKILFKNIFIGKIPIPTDHESHEDMMIRELLPQAKELQALLQKFVPYLFSKIYIEKTQKILKVSFEPTGLFVLLADTSDIPVAKTSISADNSPSALCPTGLVSLPAHHFLELF